MRRDDTATASRTDEIKRASNVDELVAEGAKKHAAAHAKQHGQDDDDSVPCLGRAAKREIATDTEHGDSDLLISSAECTPVGLLERFRCT